MKKLLLLLAAFIIATSSFSQVVKQVDQTTIDTIFISSDTVLVGNRVVRKTIFVNPNVDVTISDTLFIDEDVRIIVSQGASLTLDTAYLTRLYNNTLWEGITLLCSNNTNKSNVIMNGSTISYADTAVYVKNPFGLGVASYSGVINAINTVFINNRVAIYLSDCGGNNGSSFYKCLFSITNYDYLSIGEAFTDHVKLDNINGISFYGCTFNNLTDTLNTGTYRGRGIHAMNSQFTVDEYCSQYSSSTVCDCNTYSYPSVFEKMGCGIEAVTDGTNRLLSVQRSLFKLNGYGVKTSALNNYIVNHNQFQLNRCFYDGCYGVHSSNCTGYSIAENSFNCMVHLSENTGIYVFNSGTEENHINNNSFYRLLYGIYSDSTNGAPILAGAGLQIHCNTFYLDDTDIFIDQTSFIRRTQGSELRGVDNDITNACFMGTHSFVNLNDSIIVYHFSGPSESIHDPICSFHARCIPKAGVNDCPSVSCTNSLFNRNSSDDDILIEKYLQLRAEHEKMLQSYENNGFEQILQQYFSNNVIEDEIILTEALKLLNDINEVSEIMASVSNDAILSILSNDNYQPSKLIKWYSVINSIEAKYQLINLLVDNNDFNEAETVIRSLPNNFTLNDSQMLEYYNFFSLYMMKKNMKLESREWNSLTKDEISNLKDIALSTDGYSSAIAKNILSFYYNIHFNDRKLTLPITKDDVTKSELTSKSTNYSFEVFPNPFDDNFSISSNSPYFITVRDVLGTIVYQSFLQAGETQIKTTTWNKGMYFVSYSSENNFKTLKIIKY